MADRALSFGRMAQAYERFRPSYPEKLVDVVFEYAAEPISTALDIGAGTGKATRLFASRGIAVDALEPDPEMLDELRRHVPDGVAAIQSTFEEFTPPKAYDLVLAAASLHWTAPESRWSRIAAALRPGGVFAAIGAPVHLADPAAEAAAEQARAAFLTEEAISAPVPEIESADGLRWPGTEIKESGLFEDVRQMSIERTVSITSAHYIGLLSTVSAFIVLPEEIRQQIWDRTAQALPETVEIIVDTHVHLARTRCASPLGGRPAGASRARSSAARPSCRTVQS